MTVYVQGLLYLDRWVFIDAALREFLAVLQKNPEKLLFRWAFNGSEVGGFPAHAIRAARAKGASVTVGCILPARVPVEFTRFFDEQGIDTRYVRLTAEGPVPQTLTLRFADGGHVLIVDRGGGTYDVPLPTSDFDVLLINPGECASRRPLLQDLRTYATASGGRTTVGVVGRGDWTAQDWELVRDTGMRIYLNQQELVEALAGNSSPDVNRSTEENLAELRRAVGSTVTITVTLGNRGSMVMNHAPFLIHAGAAQVPVRNLVGPGDTLVTTATLSVASGASDGHSCLRGNMDAARRVTGRRPAASLDELDREIAQHPEMTERRIDLP